MERVIFHIDVNSAFLSWEAVYRLEHLGGNLDLREIASAVGGDVTKRHGIILAKSLPAKKYGIHTGQSVTDAVRKCPGLFLVPPNYQLYQCASQAFIALLRRYSPVVEQYSIDEAFVDMSGTEGLWGPSERAAETIREKIRKELGFTVNIGVAENKVLAKMASDFRKPDRVHTLWKWEIPGKLWPLPVADLFFVGHATEGKLRNLGIRTIGELAAMPCGILKSHMGKHGEVLWAFANGLDASAVEPEPPPNKGYGNSTTVAFDVTDRETAKLVLLSLAETLAARLRADSVKIGVVAVGIRDWDLRYYEHQVTLKVPTCSTWEIYQAACRVFDESWDHIPIRHLGIHTSGVVREMSRQVGLFDPIDPEKLKKMDSAVDQIRKRFGYDAVRRAGFLPSPAEPERGLIDHMGGGISREKRTADYRKQQIL